jgi:hypothetical protein
MPLEIFCESALHCSSVDVLAQRPETDILRQRQSVSTETKDHHYPKVFSGVQGRLAQFFAGRLAVLFSQMLFERDCLLEMKSFEVAKSGVSLEPRQRLRHGVYRDFALALGFLQISKVLPLNPFIIGVVLYHVLVAPLLVTVYGEFAALA